MHAPNRLRGLGLGIVCLVLAACTVAPAPMAAPPAPAPSPPVLPTTPSAQSRAAVAYYAQVQATLLREGMLRSDPGKEIPLTPAVLARNFLRIALFDEYRRNASGFVPEETASRLRRWVEPVRVAVRFGPSVLPDRQNTDRARVASLVNRLARVTGHPMRMDDQNPNFWIHIVSEGERQAMAPTIRAVMPGLSPADLAGITRMPPSTYCLVYALSQDGSGAYSRAFAVIRAEHPDLLRLSCLHEELAQGLGLPNDSKDARPSIFNDDEEFALLTDQDELMLRMLYSPELRPGMTIDEARPIVLRLAQRLLGTES